MRVSLLPLRDALSAPAQPADQARRLNLNQYHVFNTDGCLMECQNSQQHQDIRKPEEHRVVREPLRYDSLHKSFARSAENGCGSCVYNKAVLEGIEVGFPNLFVGNCSIRWPTGKRSVVDIVDENGHLIAALQLFVQRGTLLAYYRKSTMKSNYR
jgi:hypothetical protein